MQLALLADLQQPKPGDAEMFFPVMAQCCLWWINYAPENPPQAYSRHLPGEAICTSK